MLNKNKLSVAENKHESSFLYSFIANLKKLKILSFSEERDLFNNYKTGCNKSRDLLIKSNILSVVYLVNKISKPININSIELINEGVEGLIEALEHYDPNKGFKFKTLAQWYILRKVKNRIHQYKSVVSLKENKNLIRIQSNLRNIKKSLGIYDSFINSKNAEIICNQLNVKEKELHFIDQRISFGDYSLNSTVISENSECEVINLLSNEDYIDEVSNEEKIINNLDKDICSNKIIRKAFDKLNENEKKVINERFLNTKSKKLKEIAINLKISTARVNAIEKKAKEKIKKYYLQYIENKKGNHISKSRYA